MAIIGRRSLIAVLVGLALMVVAHDARAITVLCWGQGIPCFHVSNCGGYPACDGNNQPCCLGGPSAFAGASTYSDLITGSSNGSSVSESVEIATTLQGAAVVDLFAGGKLVAEKVVRLSATNGAVRIDLGGVSADYFRVYIDQTTEPQALPDGLKREAIVPPAVYHIVQSKGSSSKTVVRLSPEVALDPDGTSTQCP